MLFWLKLIPVRLVALAALAVVLAPLLGLDPLAFLKGWGLKSLLGGLV